MASRKLNEFKVLTFDCYGTLIDWEKGLLNALNELGISDEEEKLLSLFASLETHHQTAQPGLLYPGILELCLDDIAKQYGKNLAVEERTAFGQSIQNWPAFSDSAAALQKLGKYYKLVVLSNVDRQSFSLSEKRLGVKFDLICTAQDIGSYKPDLRNFEYVLKAVEKEFGIKKEQVLHTFQSLFHDAVPACKIGMATSHIDRRFGKAGSGATPIPSEPFTLNFYYKTLGDMADAREKEQ